MAAGSIAPEVKAGVDEPAWLDQSQPFEHWNSAWGDEPTAIGMTPRPLPPQGGFQRAQGVGFPSRSGRGQGRLPASKRPGRRTLVAVGWLAVAALAWGVFQTLLGLP